MSSPVRFLACIAAAVAACASAQAAPTIYFGENQSPAQAVSGDPLNARNAFASNLSGVGTETFESQTFNATAPLNLTFPGSSSSIGALLEGTGRVSNTADTVNAGRFNTTGANGAPAAGQWWSVEGEFTVTFSTAVSAFGFYGTDIGDFNGRLTIDLTDINDVVTSFVVDHTISGNNASLLFWGFVDSGNSYKKVTFGNTAPGTDFFGFDDMIVGDAGQVVPLPEPSTIALLGACLIGAAAARRRA